MSLLLTKILLSLGLKELKSFEPLMEVHSEVSLSSDSSKGGSGFVSPMKDYLFKDKGYYLRSCSKNVETGVMNKAHTGVLMGAYPRVSVCLHEKDPNVSLEHQSGALRAVADLSRFSP